MKATLEFDSTKYKPDTLRLILAKVQEWKCSPSEAAARLLDRLATYETSSKKGSRK